MSKGIALWSINRLLRVFGLVIVISVAVDDQGGPTRIWIESKWKYDARCRVRE